MSKTSEIQKDLSNRRGSLSHQLNIKAIDDANHLTLQCLNILRKVPSGKRQHDHVTSLVKFTENLDLFNTNMEAGGEQHRELCQVFELREMSAVNDRVIRQGEPGDHFFVILQGKIRFEIESKGEIINVGSRAAPLAFGELAILTAEPRAASAFVMEIPCSFITVHRDDYKRAIMTVHNREINSRLDFLRRIHIFRGWSTERLSDFASSLTSKRYAAGEMILKQGEKSAFMYFIRLGKVIQLYKCDREGKKPLILEIGHIGTYEYFGEDTIMNITDTSCNVICECETDLLLLASHDFLKKFNLSNLREIEERHSQCATLKELMTSYQAELDWFKFKTTLVNNVIFEKKLKKNEFERGQIIKKSKDYIIPISLETARLREKEKSMSEDRGISLVEAQEKKDTKEKFVKSTIYDKRSYRNLSMLIRKQSSKKLLASGKNSTFGSFSSSRKTSSFGRSNSILPETVDDNKKNSEMKSAKSFRPIVKPKLAIVPPQRISEARQKAVMTTRQRIESYLDRGLSWYSLRIRERDEGRDKDIIDSFASRETDQK